MSWGWSRSLRGNGGLDGTEGRTFGGGGSAISGPANKLDLPEARRLQQFQTLLGWERAGHTIGPGAAFRCITTSVTAHHVGQLQTATRPQDPTDLPEHPDLVPGKFDRPV